MEKYAAVILAAGKGTRMNEGESSPIPKVMFKLLGKPIIDHSVSSIQNAGIKKVVLVVGYRKELIEEYFGDKVEYAFQKEQLGTGHALMSARESVEGKVDSILVFYGDNPLYKTETVKKLIERFEVEKPTIAMLSVILQDPTFWAFGRIARNDNNEVTGIIEQKDCNNDQLKIKESNPGFYIFDSKWLWENIDKLRNNNAQGEYYLTDIVKIAREQGKKIIAMPVSEESEALGINTQEQLKEAEEILKKR